MILEIGSNDGAFIKNFKKNCVIGVEPCKNLAKITRDKGYKTFSEYWDVSLAKKISKKQKIDVIYSANTLSHIENFSEILDSDNSDNSIESIPFRGVKGINNLIMNFKSSILLWQDDE